MVQAYVSLRLPDLSVPDCQSELIQELAKLGKSLIGVVITGRPVIVSPLADYFDSLLYVGYPGQYGGEDLANIIFGKRNPSGKLAISIPDAEGQLPVFYNFRDTNAGKEVIQVYLKKYTNKWLPRTKIFLVDL